MNAPPRKSNNQRRKPQQRRPNAVDIWRTPPPLPDVEPIASPHDVGALLRSLGDPPLRGTAAARYFNVVAERAAAAALALALSADLLDQSAD